MKQTFIITCDKNIIKVFNSKTGLLTKTFMLPGSVVNGPIQSENQFTVILNINGKSQGRIYKLPNCFLVRSFNI